MESIVKYLRVYCELSFELACLNNIYDEYQHEHFYYILSLIWVTFHHWSFRKLIFCWKILPSTWSFDLITFYLVKTSTKHKFFWINCFKVREVFECLSLPSKSKFCLWTDLYESLFHSIELNRLFCWVLPPTLVLLVLLI